MQARNVHGMEAAYRHGMYDTSSCHNVPDRDDTQLSDAAPCGFHVANDGVVTAQVAFYQTPANQQPPPLPPLPPVSDPSQGLLQPPCLPTRLLLPWPLLLGHCPSCFSSYRSHPAWPPRSHCHCHTCVMHMTRLPLTLPPPLSCYPAALAASAVVTFHPASTNRSIPATQQPQPWLLRAPLPPLPWTGVLLIGLRPTSPAMWQLLLMLLTPLLTVPLILPHPTSLIAPSPPLLSLYLPSLPTLFFTPP